MATKLDTKLPTLNGVGPSRVFLPIGDYPNLLVFLVQKYQNSTEDGWRKRMDEGRVLNAQGQALNSSATYQGGQYIYYYREVLAEAKIPFQEEIIYQDDFIVVADKPHFLPVSPVGPFIQETLLVRLRNRLGIDTLNLAHRLDLETAGLILFTIQPHTRGLYQNLFRDKKIEKEYEAIAPLNAAIKFPMTYQSCIEESPDFMQMHEIEGEPNSETRIDLLETYGEWGRYSLHPITGRKHQLRAHLNALGIPIKNDQIYPTLQEYVSPDQRDYSKPLQLLAKRLSFKDPITGVEHQFKTVRKLDL
jgi:tRNA pseudouridine32 synthase/23S rRNA pseudouridine746 synthase